LRLNSLGGALLEAAKLADVVRYAKIATVVADGSSCASACFIVFAAGAEKFASYTASIGVHGASDASGEETAQSGAATVSMARVLKDLGVPPSIIGKMVVTPPQEMVWLASDDLRAMGTSMTGKPAQLPPDKLGERPQQVRPTLPLDLQSPTKASAPPQWKDLVEMAIAISTRQNNGRPLVVRTCQPELKVCINAVSYLSKDNTNLLVKTTENMAGKTVGREFCAFNKFGDVRNCLDWDTGASHTDMKNNNGQWIKVEDQ
jgi:hypothetical protein